MKNSIQEHERNLSENKRKEISRLRVISLRLNDYMMQSGRNNVDSSKKNDLFCLLPILQDFASIHEQEIIYHGFMTANELKNFINSKGNLGNKISTTNTFYTNSMTDESIVTASNFKLSPSIRRFFYFIEFFLNVKGDEFGIDYKYNFYKDIYDFANDNSESKIKVKIKSGIYRLERLSSLHRGNKISVSKLDVIECIDPKGKNVFNDPNRSRFRFVEKKHSISKDEHGNDEEYDSTCKGRIVVRNRQNYIFLGTTVHKSLHKKEKTIQVMSFVVKENGNLLEGVVLDTTGGSSYIPFAARVRAVLVASSVSIDSTNKYKFKKYLVITDKDIFKNRELSKNDDFFINKDNLNGDDLEPRGIISAFFKEDTL